MRGRRLLAVVFAVTMAATASAAGDKERLTGTWRGQTTFLGYPAVSESILMADGTFTTLVQAQGYMGRHWGKWRIVGDGTLRLTYEGHEPTQFCGPLGCTDIRNMDAETVFYRFLDDGRLVTRPSVCMLPPCETMLVRTR